VLQIDLSFVQASSFKLYNDSTIEILPETIEGRTIYSQYAPKSSASGGAASHFLEPTTIGSADVHILHSPYILSAVTKVVRVRHLPEGTRLNLANVTVLESACSGGRASHRGDSSDPNPSACSCHKMMDEGDGSARSMICL
jgi:hypothetical protein